jgi:hypothetical protein
MEYNSWLMAQDADKPIPCTTCRQVANWIISAKRNISNDTLKNAWKKTGYSYFGVFAENGVFAGEDAIVGDNLNGFVEPVLGGDDNFDLEDNNGVNDINLRGGSGEEDNNKGGV